jgi:hypothetical protein
MRLHWLSLLGFSALSLGCSGGQTGDLSGSNKQPGKETGGNLGGGCEQHRQELGSLDEMTDYGSAEQVLAFAETSFEAPLTWKEPAAGASWSAGPEAGESTIVIDVVRGEKAYLLSYEAKQSESGATLGLLCPPPQLGVEAHVTVTSEGGALSETFDTLLLSQGGRLATFSAALDLSKLGGDLSVSYAKPGAKLVQVSLNATLLAEGTTGSLAGIEQVEQGDVTSAGAAVLAVWPNAPACAIGDGIQDGSGLAVAADASALGITGEAAAELISSMTPVGIEWLDGTSTELTLTTVLQGDGCLRASAPNGIPMEHTSGSVTYPALFKLESADGRVNGEYSGKLLSFPEGDQHGVTAESYTQLTPAQVAESGFSSVQVPSGVEYLVVGFDARRNGALEAGSIYLNGMTNSPCPMAPQPEPGSGMGAASPGCAGAMRTVIETATW